MQEQRSEVRFEGSVPGIQRQLLPVLGLTLAFVCILALGSSWWRFYLVLAGFSLPLGIIVARISSSKNWFLLDDQNQRIVMAFKQGIPYDKVTAIQIVEINGHLSVSVQKGRLSKVSLVQSLSSRDKWRLKEELKKRFREDILHETKFAQWKLTLSMYMAPLLPCVFFIAFSYYIHYKYPQTTAVPRVKTWESIPLSSEATKEYRLGRISFRLPETFSIEQEKERTLFFESETHKTDLQVYY